MTRCAEFYQKWSNDENWCNKCSSSVSLINSYLELLEQFTAAGIPKKLTMVKLPERAARPLFQERSPILRQKAMDAVVECLKTGKHPFNGRFSGKITSGLVNTLLRKLRRQETTPIIDAATIPDEIRDKVLLCDIKDAPTRVPENTVDMILTDPPYGKEYVPLWGDLGRFATHALKDGGLLVAYCGHANLLDCCNQLSQSLKYLWISALIHSGTLADVYGLRFIAGWKPIVIFCKGHYEAHDEWFKDVIEGTGREKGSHDWQQAVGELTYFLNYFTKPQDFVVDPFCGSGTTLVACKNMNRRYLGFDIDSDCVNTAIGRLTRYG